jgi:hypothetical protein
MLQHSDAYSKNYEAFGVFLRWVLLLRYIPRIDALFVRMIRNLPLHRENIGCHEPVAFERHIYGGQ